MKIFTILITFVAGWSQVYVCKQCLIKAQKAKNWLKIENYRGVTTSLKLGGQSKNWGGRTLKII